VPGLDFYRVVTVGVADLSATEIVAVEQTSGDLVRGKALFTRIRAVVTHPEALAQAALGTLLSEAHRRPLQPDAHLGTWTKEADRQHIEPPRIEEGVLIFWEMRRDMMPELVERRVNLNTGDVATETVLNLRLAANETLERGSPQCEPVASCGCWTGCASVRAVRIPGRPDSDDTYRVEGGDDAGRILVRRSDCVEVDGQQRCLRICSADTPQAYCMDALVAEDEACTEACPPREAPFHCETTRDGYRQVDHPVRAAAR